MCRRRLPNATIRAGTKRSQAVPPRRANDHNTNRWVRVCCAHPARGTVVRNASLRFGIPRFLQGDRVLSKSPSSELCRLAWREIEPRVCWRDPRSARPHLAFASLPGFSVRDRTARSAGPPRSRAANVAVGFRFLDCQLERLLGACREVRPADWRVCSVPASRFPAALCGTCCGRRGDAVANDHAARLPDLRGAADAGCATAGRRWRETISALLLLLPGMGVPANLVPHVRGGGGREIAGVRRGAISAGAGRGLRDVQILSANRRSHQRWKRGAAGG